jgi:hypothetical protein
MIWNFVTYLRSVATLVNERFYVDAKDIINSETKVPDRMVLIQESGGTPVPIIKNTTVMIQIITRDIDVAKCRLLAFKIFDEINDRFGLILPAVTIDGVVYAAIQTGQISANSEPQFLGYDEQGRPEFSTNYRIIYRR